MNENTAGKKPRLKVGVLAMVLSPLVAALPLIFGIALARLFCGPNANEADCSWAVLPWFTFYTIPAAVVMFITGLVISMISIFKR